MKTTVRRPFSHTRLTRFLEKRILELRPRKSQIEIAAEAGFVQTNMLAMIKNGSTKLPLDRVPGLAKALECDPRHLFLLAMEQLGNETNAQAIAEIFGAIVTRNEVAWLEEIRTASGHSDPSLTVRARSAIKAIFGK
ncbi:XRE family transcriptional regulator [Rhizobium sp. C1]|uniref:XRE family transcriptional regulator n=1 Tax=Rhizobium sp. C1 TaxID=1349799 RepID=UPI001E33C9B0|nr:XRE family transcriptional regulator [Rhizobium sp. C1]MCD2179598.1 XRE family transcriptional regulator [Rhizobium sp. C1]